MFVRLSMPRGARMLARSRNPLTGSWPQSGTLVGVAGATGAPGRSLLSVAIAQRASARGIAAALVDLDPNLGSLAAYLDLSESHSLSYLVHDAALHPVDSELVDRHLQTRGSTYVLTGLSEPATPEAFPVRVALSVLAELRRRSGLVIADTGALTSSAGAATLSACDVIVWVIHGSRLGLDLFERTFMAPTAQRLRAKPALVLVNHHGPGSPRDITGAMRRRFYLNVVATIPHVPSLTWPDGLGARSDSIKAIARGLDACLDTLQAMSATTGVGEPAAVETAADGWRGNLA